jgi:AraC-like DNA-binding protein
MPAPIDLPIVRLTASQFWKDDFPFSIFTIRHHRDSYPHQYCRNFWKIIYVIAGRGAEVIDGVAYELQPDTLFVIHPDDVTSFNIAVGESIEICNIIFMPELIAFGTALLDKPADFLQIFQAGAKPTAQRELRERLYVHKADSATAALIRAMLKEFNQAKTNHRAVLRLQLLELLCRIARQSEQKSHRDRGKSIADQAAQLIRERFRDNLSGNSLAARLGVSRQYLSRVFSRHYGCSIGEAVRNQRLGVARQLIIHDHSLTISEICYACGFNDLSYFYRLFKAAYACHPGALRK